MSSKKLFSEEESYFLIVVPIIFECQHIGRDFSQFSDHFQCYASPFQWIPSNQQHRECNDQCIPLNFHPSYHFDPIHMDRWKFLCQYIVWWLLQPIKLHPWILLVLKIWKTHEHKHGNKKLDLVKWKKTNKQNKCDLLVFIFDERFGSSVRCVVKWEKKHTYSD